MNECISAERIAAKFMKSSEMSSEDKTLRRMSLVDKIKLTIEIWQDNINKYHREHEINNTKAASIIKFIASKRVNKENR